jgi:hypothetical protein
VLLGELGRVPLAATGKKTIKLSLSQKEESSTLSSVFLSSLTLTLLNRLCDKVFANIGIL